MAVTTESPHTTPSKGELTRRAILDAAIARFGRDGFRTTSVADIARDAGLSGTAAYAYFSNKEALFLAAVDHDTAEVIREGITAFADPTDPLPDQPTVGDGNWRESLVFTLVDALDSHPLAHRLLAGLEPEVSARVIDIPALNDLRRVIADQLRREQDRGLVRADIDPDALGRGFVTIILSLLMSVTQLGLEATVDYAADVRAVFDAALEPVRS